jgi:hypothetical protein
LSAASSALSIEEPPAAQDCEEILARKDADIEQAHRKVSAAPLMLQWLHRASQRGTRPPPIHTQLRTRAWASGSAYPDPTS